LPLEARAVVFFARAVVLRLLRPELAERERADAERLRLELREDFADALRVRPLLRPEALRPEVLRLRVRLRPAVLRVRAEVRDLRRFPPVRVPPEREPFARVERERFPELRRALVERVRACVERLRPRLRPADSFCCAVSRLTSLLKRLSDPSSKRNARLLSSNLRKKSSQEISSRVPSPLNPGKSMRRMPGSPPRSVAATVEGTPPRSSAHRRISS